MDTQTPKPPEEDLDRPEFIGAEIKDPWDDEAQADWPNSPSPTLPAQDVA